MFETLASARRPAADEADVTQILTPIFHALSEREGEFGAPEPVVTVDQDPPQLAFDQPTEKRGPVQVPAQVPLQVVAGRAAGGAHRARSTAAPARSYSNRAGCHSKSAQSAARLDDPSALPTAAGAHRAPEDHNSGTGGFVVRGNPVNSGNVGDSGSHHAVSRTGGRHRTLRAVLH